MFHRPEYLCFLVESASGNENGVGDDAGGAGAGTKWRRVAYRGEATERRWRAVAGDGGEWVPSEIIALVHRFIYALESCGFLHAWGGF
jgi:hypothetical protein